MKILHVVLAGCIAVFTLTGCGEPKPEPFDVTKVDCENLKKIKNPEHLEKATKRCNSLKARESRYEPTPEGEVKIR